MGMTEFGTLLKTHVLLFLV